MTLKTLLKDFQRYSGDTNERAVKSALNVALGNQERLEKVMLLDADRTLAPQDIGSLF
jgi:hypothetical protein